MRERERERKRERDTQTQTQIHDDDAKIRSRNDTRSRLDRCGCRSRMSRTLALVFEWDCGHLVHVERHFACPICRGKQGRQACLNLGNLVSHNASTCRQMWIEPTDVKQQIDEALNECVHAQDHTWDFYQGDDRG